MVLMAIKTMGMMQRTIVMTWITMTMIMVIECQTAGIHNEMTDIEIETFIMRLVNNIKWWRRAVPP